MSNAAFRLQLNPWMAVLACVPSMLACQRGRNFEVIEELRIPALQVLQVQDAPTDTNLCRQIADSTACQQYPLRFAKKVYFRFLALAPAGSEPISIRLTGLQRGRIAQPLPRTASCLDILNAEKTQEFLPVPLSQLGLAEAGPQGEVQQESPLRVEEHTVTFTAPEQAAVEAEVSSSGDLPLYKLEYEATTAGLRADRGYFTFAFSPEVAASSSINDKCWARLMTGNSPDATNIAPQIASIEPAQGAVVDASPQNLTLNFKGVDTDADAKQRIQWYISRGELENKGAASTKLTFSGSEPLTAVGIVRDLQGGVDFAWTTFSANP